MNIFTVSRIGKSFASVAGMLATPALTAANGAHSALDPAGPQAQTISRLWWLMFYVCTAVLIGVVVVLILAITRRRKPSTEDDLKPELELPVAGERKRRNIIAAATAFTVVTLFVLLISSFFVGRALTAELAAKQGVAIEITGHQWWWEVRYLNDDASSIFTTANEI